MCGRYCITTPPEAVRSWFAYEEQPNFPPRYNIAPTQPIPIVCRDDTKIGDAGRHFRLVRWGLVPSFVKDWGKWPLIINARSEEIATKPSFRAALMRRRCLVIADGFYEWRRTGDKTPSIPFLIRPKDRGLMGFAGLHERWLGADGSEMETACIVTTAANATLSAVHSRMPVILDRDRYGAWLDCDRVDVDQAMSMLKPAGDELLDLTEIGTAVNKVSNDDAYIQNPVSSRREAAPIKPPEGQFSLF